MEGCDVPWAQKESEDSAIGMMSNGRTMNAIQGTQRSSSMAGSRFLSVRGLKAFEPRQHVIALLTAIASSDDPSDAGYGCTKDTRSAESRPDNSRLSAHARTYTWPSIHNHTSIYLYIDKYI